jgi:fucose permease
LILFMLVSFLLLATLQGLLRNPWRAIDMTVVSSARRAPFPYFISFIGIGLQGSALGPSLKTLRGHTNVTLGAIGIVFTFGAIGYGIGSLIGGRLIDRFSPHRVMAGCAFGAALFFASIPFAGHLWLLALLNLCAAAFIAVIDVGGNALILWFDRDGSLMNALHFSFGVGALIAPLAISASLRSTSDVRVAFIGFGVLLMLISAMFWLLPSPPRPAPENRPSAGPAPAPGGSRQLLLGIMVAFFIAYVGVEIAFAGWISDFGIAHGFDATTTAAWLASAFWGSFTIGRGLAIAVARRVAPNTVLFGSAATVVVAQAVLMVGAGTALVVWVATIFTGLGMAAMFPTMMTLAESLIRVDGTTAAWFLGGASAGVIVLPWLTGKLFDSYGPGAVPPVVLCGGLVTGALVLAVQRAKLRA